MAIGTRHINDDSRVAVGRIGFEGDGGQGAEEQVTGVGHDGGAARPDPDLAYIAKQSSVEIADRVESVIRDKTFFWRQTPVPDAGARI